MLRLSNINHHGQVLSVRVGFVRAVDLKNWSRQAE